MTRLHPDDIAAIAERVVLLIRSEMVVPAGVSNQAARLISLANIDRGAAIAEAKRLAREDSARNRRASHA